MVSASAPIKNCILKKKKRTSFCLLFSYRYGVMGTSLIGFQKQVFQGSITQVGVLKLEILNVQVKFFASQEAIGISGFPPEYPALCQGEIYGKIYLSLSYLFQFGYFLIHSMYKESFSLFLDFSQREMHNVQLYIWCEHRKREIQGVSYVVILA